MSSTTKEKKSKGSKRLPLAVGMWKDKWPASKSSIEIARKIRLQQWKRK